MKSYQISLMGICLLISCGRVNVPSATDKKAKVSTTLSQEKAKLRSKAATLILDQSSGEISDEGIRELALIGNDLLNDGLITEIIGAVPDAQLPKFKGLLIDALKQFAPKDGQPPDPQYRGVLRIARRLKDPEVANTIMDHLILLPTYHFPTEALPNGWAIAELSEHVERGMQGLVASTVVEYGNIQAMQRYRLLLQTAQPDVKRVMIWALGKSPDAEDFEILWQIQLQADNPVLREAAKRALNAMTISMERVAKYPGSQINRSIVASQQLEDLAVRNKNRLKNAGLLVTLTPWD